MSTPFHDANAKLLILRDLLFEERESPETWELLCAALDDWPTDDSLPIAFDYIQSHLDLWPDALRLAPRRWWEVVRGGGDEPRFSLARKLSLAAYGGGAKAVAALLGEPTMGRLTILDLSHNRLTAAEAVRLARSPHLAGLKDLDLGLNELGGKGVAAVVAAPWFAGLERLDLTSNQIPNEGLAAFAALGSSGLRSLVLWGNGIGPMGAQDLASSPGLDGLERLNLGWNAVGDEGASALLRAGWLAGLSHLDLSNNKITGEGTRVLVEDQTVWRLPRVDLRGNAVGAELRALCQRHRPDWLV